MQSLTYWRINDPVVDTTLVCALLIFFVGLALVRRGSGPFGWPRLVKQVIAGVGLLVLRAAGTIAAAIVVSMFTASGGMNYAVTHLLKWLVP